MNSIGFGCTISLHEPKKYSGICQSTMNSVILPQRRLVIGLVEAGNSLVFVLISIEDGD